MQNRQYEVYILIDPIDFLVKYVGMTTNPEGRKASHWGTRFNPKTRLDMWIWNLAQEGKKVIYEPVRQLDDEEEARHFEKWMIRFMEDEGFPLVNVIWKDYPIEFKERESPKS